MKKEDSCCNNSCGITSVILGLVGSVFGILILPIVISITGLVFGIIQYKRAKNAWAIWGIVLSSIGIVISLYMIWQIVVVAGSIQQMVQTCAADPTAAGCEGFSQLTGGAQ